MMQAFGDRAAHVETPNGEFCAYAIHIAISRLQK